MANRPSDFNTNTPTGASSPRQGDDELRKIKLYTQNSYNDLTAATGAGVERTNLFGNVITALTNFVGNLTGNVTGNATTATAWQNPRTVELTGVVTGSQASVDGSANVSIATSITDGGIATADLADNAVTPAKLAYNGNNFDSSSDELVIKDDGVSTQHINVAAVGTTEIADDAVTYAKMQDLGTANRVLGGTATGTITETQVATAMIADDAVTNAKLADDAVGTAQIADDAITNALMADNAVTLGTQTTGNYVATIAGTTNEVTVTGSGSESASVTIGLPDTINAATTGNAATATALANARTIGLTGAATGSATFDGTDNISIPVSLTTNVTDAQNFSGAVAYDSDVTFGASSNVSFTSGATLSLPNESVNEARLHISNAGTNGQVLTKQSGNAGGLTWANAASPNNNTISFTGGDVTSSGTFTLNQSSNEAINLQIGNGVVDTAQLADDAVETSKLAYNGANFGSLNNELIIADGGVRTQHIANTAVTTAKLRDANVTRAKIAADAVDSEHLANAAVLTAAIADDAVTNAKIADGAIDTTAKIADNVVTSAKISGQIAIADGGTGASTATAAASALGVGTEDTPRFTGVDIGTSTQWNVSVNSSNELVFEYNGTDVFKISSTGAITAAGNVTASGTV